MNDGLVVAVGFIVVIAVAVLCFGMGRGSVAENCEAYGKAQINKSIYVCSKQ